MQVKKSVIANCEKFPAELVTNKKKLNPAET